VIRRLLVPFRRREPPANAQLLARLDEQDAAVARLRLRLDEAVLALDQRHLDHYALTELARAELQLRANRIDDALSSPDGPVAELLAAEAGQLDSYLIHHTAMLRRDIEALRATVPPSTAGVDVVVRAAGFDLSVPDADARLIDVLQRLTGTSFEPGLGALLLREIRPGSRVVEVVVATGLQMLRMAQAVGEGGEVVTFEGDPRRAVSLRRSLALNGLASRAEVREVAVAGPRAVSTLDAEIAPGTRVDLVRVGAEGVAPSVWAGSERLRRDNPGIVYVVAWSGSHLRAAGADPATAMAAIREAGFTPFVLAQGDEEGGITPLQRDPSELESGILLLRRA
jgi:hypothetical protein